VPTRKQTKPPASASPAESPEDQLARFMARFTPEIASLAESALMIMRRRLPSAHQMVYDNYNALVIGFCPNERPSDAIFSVAIYPRTVALCFLQGAGLPDPDGILAGSGTVARHIGLKDAKTLDRPEVRSMINVALHRAKVPLDPANKGRLIIRSISAKQRPRRPTD
jgi:hypothetical protein